MEKTSGGPDEATTSVTNIIFLSHTKVTYPKVGINNPVSDTKVGSNGSCGNWISKDNNSSCTMITGN